MASPHNLSAQNWNTEFVRQDYDSVSIGFSAFLADGVDGYPGNRTFHAEYTLDDNNWLTIRYRASTDRPTYINMSNHTYWNLSGDFSSSALDETLTVFANNVCLNNEEHIPVEIIPLQGRYSIFPARLLLKAGWISAARRKTPLPLPQADFHRARLQPCIYPEP